MPPPKKYKDFTESVSIKLPSKHPPHHDRYYTDITCPHCNTAFVRIPSDQLCLKASKCKAHLEVCSEFKAKGGDVTPAPLRASTSELLKQMRDMEARAEARHRESMARLSQAFGLGDPDAQTENELVVRGKRKIDEARGNVFHTLPMTDEAIKQYRVFLHSDKDKEIEKKYSPEVNELRAAMLEQLLESVKRRRT